MPTKATGSRPGTSMSMADSGTYSPVHQSSYDNESATQGAGAASGGSWFRRHKLLTGLIAGLIVLAVALGVGLGVGLSMNNSSSSSGSSSSSDRTSSGTDSSSDSDSGSSSDDSGSSSDSGNSSSTTITALAKWNLTDPNTKMYGASLGSWLVLERWMNEDWMVQTGGDDAWDEWSFIENLGADAALTALQAHWDSWVSEAELDTMQSAGFNTIRIPVGYWAFIPAASGEPYLAMSGQKEQMDKMLGWLHARGMYASIDLHGLPGSQNGDQSSGHNTSSSSTKIAWFSDENQQLSLETLNATIAWIQSSNYSSVVNSIGIVNEPRPMDSSFSSSQQTANLATLTTYYETAYQYCLAAGIPALFHHGFYTGSETPANYWRSFATGKDPNYLGYEDHPYPGWFTSNNNSKTYMENNVCEIVQGAVGYPVPMLITEWSAINGVYDDDWTRTYQNLQAAGYAWSGGSVFWSFKVENSTTQILSLAPELQTLYSAVSLIESGFIPKPASGQTNVEFLQSQSGADECGTFQLDSWTNPSTSGTSYTARKRSLEQEDQQKSYKRKIEKRVMTS